MRNLITNYIKEIAKNKTKRRRVQMIVSMLSLAVALTVFWQLRIVGISMTGEALCGKLEHTHTLDCLVMQNVCGREESEGHAHSEECYIAETEQICQKEVHSHSDDCLVKREQICELEEHQHEDVCVQSENVVVCLDETEGHEHLPECYETRTIHTCEREEHAHVEGQCYVFTSCICEKEEHQHEDSCFETKDKLICGKDEAEGHTHSPECQLEINGCGYEEEHVHTVLCYANAEADLETSADWEASIPALTGNAREDLIAVARSQLGYTESQQNYKVAADNTTKMGYTRYGEWYGNPYGDWNAMFVSFCLNYSNHPDYTVLKNTGVETMRRAAVGAGKYTAVESNPVPGTGSIVFLDKDCSGSADHAAVVTYAGNGVISVVEGDLNGTVAEVEYAMSNGTIMGYALQPVREPQVLTSPNPNSNNAQSAEEGYSLRYVCGCSADHDVGASDYGATVELDQSLSELPIPTAAAVNDQSCENYGKIFTGWYVRNGETGEEVDFGTDTLLTDDYLAPDTEDTINIYARWAAAPTSDTVTVTFVIDTETTETVHLNAGDPLGEDNYWAYVPLEVEGLMFDGWKTEGGTVIYEDTPITADITLYPIMQEIVSVFFEFSEYTVDMQIAKGTALGDQFYELDLEEFADRDFLGWVAQGSEGSTDYLTAETVIYEDTTYVPVFGKMITLTFMNGEAEFAVVRNVPQGALVWNYLPEETPEYTGTSERTMEFAGWGRKNGEAVELITETAEAEADTVLYAVFEEATSFKVYLHDMAPDGVTDYEQEAQKGRINLPMDMTLQTYLESNPYHMHRDGKLAAECKWYIKQTVDGNEAYVAYTLASPVETELHLYTFHYTVTLTRQNAATASLDVSEDGNTLTLTLREGEKPTAADFVINGEDYTLYTWNYDDNGTVKTLNLFDIIANGVTRNITAVAAEKQATVSKIIWFYAIVNNKRMLLSSDPVPCVFIGNRYYVTAALLEKLYADFGFEAEMLRPGTYYFPHADAGRTDGKIWADADVVEKDGLYYSPVVGDDRNADVYYLPRQTLRGDSKAYTEFLTTDTFYTLTISDKSHYIYGSDEEIPPVKYVLPDETGTVKVTLPDPSAESGASWLVNGNPLIGGTSNGDGTSTYTLTNVTAPILINSFTENMFNIGYAINLGNFTPTSTIPNIKGSATYDEIVEVMPGGTYIIGTPSVPRFTVYHDNSLHTVVFRGWAVNGDTENLIPAGEKLTGAQLKQRYGTDIVLSAQWERLGNDHSVSFYLNLELQVADYSGNTDRTDNENYTGALYGTELIIDPCPKCDEGENLSMVDVIFADSPTETAAIDAKIRQLSSGIEATYMGAERTFALGAFPNDEIMLSKVRDAQAGYIAQFKASSFYNSNEPRDVTEYRAQKNSDGVPLYRIICAKNEDGKLQYIPVDELTSENYTIRWYVLKLSNNGWHVDGVLVKKEGQLTVTKTFYGDADAIAEVKNGYTISVKENGANGTLAHTLNLNQKSDDNTTGYTAYDRATDTYTWVIPLTTSKNYTLLENGHTYAGSKANIASLAEYSIANPEQGTTPTNGRVPYDSTKGVSVVAKGYNVDLHYTSYQTVQFYNSYMSTEALTVSKMDNSGVSLPGVSFRLYKTVDGQQELQRIWRDANGVYYIYHEPGTTEVTSGNITVDSHGYASVIGLATYAEDHTFALAEEIVPQGYIKIEPIQFKVNPATADNPNFSVNLEENAAAELLADGSTIRVTNTSITMDVTVVKKWVDGTNLPVKVRLTREGTPLSEYDEQTLSTENNWTATWTGVPVYVGGNLANYSVKETWIGSTAYNGGDYADGYDDYLVSVAQSVYTYGENGLPTAASITVSNQTHTGGLSFKKVDEKGVGLARALFQLYTVETCEHIGSGEPCEHAYGDGVRSDLHGNVNFGSLAAGTYYMREIMSPAGYEPNDTVYKIVVSGSGTTLTVNGSDAPISVIVNTPATAPLKVRKVDGDGNILPGAVFRVYMYNEETDAYDITVTRNGLTQYTSDQNGMLTVPDLMPGSYKLIEVTAPAGYYRMAEEIDFTVALARINVTGESPNENSWSFDGKDTVTVVNVVGTELPQTGGMGTHYGTMAGLLMMAGSLLYRFLLRRKRERRGAV